MNLWNIKDLSLPPVNTYNAPNNNIDLKSLYNTCERIKSFFDDNNYMKAEYLVLSRIIYRMKQKFRSAKDFKALEKVHKALENYFNVQISKHVGTFMSLIPLRGTEIYLPTRNLLDYILVRFQGMVKLLEHIVETCKIAGLLLNARIKVGHFWKIAFLSFSLISRVYILAKHNAKHICEFYDSLLPFNSQLKNIKNNWLPDGYKLPNDLKAWMDVNWLDTDDNDDVIAVETFTNTPEIMHFIDLIKDDDVEFCDEYLMIDDDSDVQIVDDVKKSNRKNCSSGSLRGFYSIVEDLGDIIDVESTVSIIKNKRDCPNEILDNSNQSSIESQDTDEKEKYEKKDTLEMKQMEGETMLSLGNGNSNEDNKTDEDIKDKTKEDLGDVINIRDSSNESIIWDSPENECSSSSIEIVDEPLNITKKKRKNIKKKIRGNTETKALKDSTDDDNIERIHTKIKRKTCDVISGKVYSKKIKLSSDLSSDIPQKNLENQLNVRKNRKKKGKNK